MSAVVHRLEFERLGTDFVSVARVREALARQPRLKAVCFTSAEIEDCELSVDPAERFAARWAAKEAVLKCLGRNASTIGLCRD